MPPGSVYRSTRRAGKVSCDGSIQTFIMDDVRYFHSTVAKDESQPFAADIYKGLIKPKRPPFNGGRWYNTVAGIMSRVPKEGIEPSFPEGTRF